MKQETFRTTQNLVLENSFGVVGKEDSVLLDITVGIKENEDGRWGWFEISDIKTGGNDWYAEGSLEIEGMSVTGYDGVFELIEPIINKLKEWGYNTDEIE
jgi:hypothetical protein